jgi:hypothetical protein
VKALRRRRCIHAFGRLQKLPNGCCANEQVLMTDHGNCQSKAGFFQTDESRVLESFKGGADGDRMNRDPDLFECPQSLRKDDQIEGEI